MITPQMSLLDLTVEFGISGDVIRHLDGKNIVPVPRHDRFLVDMVNDGL